MSGKYATDSKPQLWHQLMLERLLVDPSLTNEQLGLEFNVSRQTIQLVRSGDMFQALLADRLASLQKEVDQSVRDRITNKVNVLAEKALDTLTDQLDMERKANHMAVQRGTLETTEMALKALGFISPKAPPASQVVNVQANVIVDNSVLEKAREKMRALNGHRPATAGDGQVEGPALLPAPAQLP